MTHTFSGKPIRDGYTPNAIASEFPQKAGLIYLNHAAVSPWPRRTVEAVQAFAVENMRQGARDYVNWTRREQALRHALARLLNAPSADDIALLKNTSEALSTVAYGIEWHQGDNIVSFAEEFPSNRIVWESLATRGVELRLVDLSTAKHPEEALISRCDSGTRLVSCSSVQYRDGLRMDLGRIGDYCRGRKILFCVDAIQSLGALPFDVQACQADFVMADGHKWMLGPEGLALFYCRRSIREKLRLHQYGWHMVEHLGDFDRTDWRPAAGARRFECGSPNMLGIHALLASVELLLAVGIEDIETSILENSRRTIECIDRDGYQLITSRERRRHSGIVTFRVPGADPSALHGYLLERGVVCAPRGGGLRFSPHFYTDPEHIEQAFEILRNCL